MMVEPCYLHVGSILYPSRSFSKKFPLSYGLILQGDCKAEATIVVQTVHIYHVETPRRLN